MMFHIRWSNATYCPSLNMSRSIIFIISVSNWVLHTKIHFFAEYWDICNDDGVAGEGWRGMFEASKKRERWRNGNACFCCYNHYSFLSVTVVTQRCPGAGGNPHLWHTDGTQHIFPPWSYGHNTRLPCILIFLSSHGDITAAPSERRLEAKPHSQAGQMYAHSTALGTTPCCSLFHLLLLELRKWKQRPQRTLDRSEE